jgi:hypothetical protein
MGRIRKTDRKNCQKPDPSINLTPQSPRKARTIIDTPRRVRLLSDAHFTVGKLPRKELFKLHNISASTGYRILQSKEARRSERIHNRGRKPVPRPQGHRPRKPSRKGGQYTKKTHADPQENDTQVMQMSESRETEIQPTCRERRTTRLSRRNGTADHHHKSGTLAMSLSYPIQ